MRIPRFNSRATIFCVGLLMLILTVLSAGCSANGQSAVPTASEGDTVVKVFGTRPKWDVEDMLKQSDAVVIGTVSRDLGAKQQPGTGEPPKLYYKYKDYEFMVEEVLNSKASLPERIAILIEDGATAANGAKVVGLEDIPTIQNNERMLLFLESLEGPKFTEGVGRPVPKGFTESTYFQLIIGSQFAKMLPEGDKWEDVRTGEAFTIMQLKDAIDRHDEVENVSK